MSSFLALCNYQVMQGKSDDRSGSSLTHAQAGISTEEEAEGNEELQDLVAALVTASRALVGISARSMAALDGAVTLTQFRTLVVLSSHGSTGLRRLADRLGVKSSTTLRTVDRLVAAGMVSRSHNKEDRREVILELTDYGHKLVNEVTTRRWRDIERIVAVMQPQHRVGMVEALVAFAEAADEPLVVEISTMSW